MRKEGRELLGFSYLQTRNWISSFPGPSQDIALPFFFLALLQQFPIWNDPHSVKNSWIYKGVENRVILASYHLFSFLINSPLFLQELPLLHLINQPITWPFPQATAVGEAATWIGDTGAGDLGFKTGSLTKPQIFSWAISKDLHSVAWYH